MYGDPTDPLRQAELRLLTWQFLLLRESTLFRGFNDHLDLKYIIMKHLSTRMESETLRSDAIFGSDPGSARASRLEPGPARPQGRGRPGNPAAHRTKQGDRERKLFHGPQNTKSS